MKPFFILIFAFLLSIKVLGQTPQAFSFQGLALDNSGNPVSNSNISVNVKIVKSISGTNVIYEEKHTVNTNNNGLYSLQVGRGNVVIGDFSKIVWEDVPLFISIGIDINGGSNFILAGTSELLSVPYAFRAGRAEVQPMIYIEPSSNKTIKIYNTTNFKTSQSFYNFNNYHWIQGKPENVYVEYKGLPDNILLTSAIFNGNSYDYIVNDSKVDTITDGIIVNSLIISIKDTTVIIPEGTYPIDLIFRTKNENLDTIRFEMKVLNKIYGDCFPVLPSTKKIKTNSCPEIDSLLEKEITISEATATEILMTSMVDGTRSFKIKMFTNCTSFNYEKLPDEKIGNYEIFGVSNFSFKDNKVSFNLEFLDPNGNMYNPTKTCYIVYD